MQRTELSGQEKVYRKCVRFLLQSYFPDSEQTEDWVSLGIRRTVPYKNQKGKLVSRVIYRYSSRSLEIAQTAAPLAYDERYTSVPCYDFRCISIECFKNDEYLSLKKLEESLVAKFNALLKSSKSMENLMFHKEYYIENKCIYNRVVDFLTEDERTLLKGEPVQMELRF